MKPQPDKLVSYGSAATGNGSADGRRRKRSAALLSILSNSALVAAKLIVGVLSGSVSVLSEAIHSATDLVASFIALFSVRVSDTPPDAEHPYGHGKIEGVSGFAEALLILLAALYIVFEAVSKLVAHEARQPQFGAGLIVMGISTVTNFFLSRHLNRVASETDSLALRADAEHLRTDVITSFGVFVGLMLARLTGRYWFDPVAALCVALLIIYTAYDLTRHALVPLLDQRLPDSEEEVIKNILNKDVRVMGYHKLRTRKSGSQRHADVHVQMDDETSLVDAHTVSEELEDGIRTAFPNIHVNIHIEPYYAEMRHQTEVHGLTPEEANPKSLETESGARKSSRLENS